MNALSCSPAAIIATAAARASNVGAAVIAASCTAFAQGLTLVHFSARPEPFLTQNTPLAPPNIRNIRNPPPNNPNTTSNRRTPYLTKSAQVELKSGRV